MPRKKKERPRGAISLWAVERGGDREAGRSEKALVPLEDRDWRRENQEHLIKSFL